MVSAASEATTVVTIFVLPAALWLGALVSILKNDFKDNTTKVIWLILTLVLPMLGPLLYFFIGRKQRVKKIHKRAVT